MHTTRNILLFVILITVCGLGAYGVFLWSFFSLHEELSELTNEIETVEAREAELLQRAESLESISDDLVDIESSFIGRSEQSVADLAGLLENSANNIGVSLEINSFEDVQKNDNDALAVSLAFTGTWQEVWRMFVLVENLPYFVEVSRFTTREVPDQRGRWEGMMEFTILKELELEDGE